MNSPTTLVLDLGSHSVKVYSVSTEVNKVTTKTWQLLETRSFFDTVYKTLLDIVSPFSVEVKKIAIGTEAMRRNPRLERIVKSVCLSLNVNYRTISQEEEAALIFKAMKLKDDQKHFDIVNAGGGSIQIVNATTAQTTLLPFGISDLNRRFQLSHDTPSKRQVSEAISWIEQQLPSMNPFVYTGGEETYLRKLGIILKNGFCSKDYFVTLSEILAQKNNNQLFALSPYDPAWMSGAIASNSIVIACLNKSKTEQFLPSDFNIGHGLVGAVV